MLFYLLLPCQSQQSGAIKIMSDASEANKSLTELMTRTRTVELSDGRKIELNRPNVAKALGLRYAFNSSVFSMTEGTDATTFLRYFIWECIKLCVGEVNVEDLGWGEYLKRDGLTSDLSLTAWDLCSAALDEKEILMVKGAFEIERKRQNTMAELKFDNVDSTEIDAQVQDVRKRLLEDNKNTDDKEGNTTIPLS